MEPNSFGRWFTLVAGPLLALGGCPLAGGCMATLQGTGELGFGVRNDNMIVAYHKADPSAEHPNGLSVAEMQVESLVQSLLDLGWAKPEDESKPEGEGPGADGPAPPG